MLTPCRILLLLVIISQVNIASSRIRLRLPFKIPFLSFYEPQTNHQRPPNQYHYPQHLHQYHPQPLKREHRQQPQLPQNHLPVDYYHGHKDDASRYNLHDPDSSVQFYFKEFLSGPSKRVDVYDDGCRRVPIMDYWHRKPKSLIAKNCITVFHNSDCNGEGVKVAGTVDLRSMPYGISSFKPCEKNIQIKFMPAVKHNHY